MLQSNCKQCSKVYIAKTKSQKYCSEACRHKFYNVDPSRVIQNGSCKHCNTSFIRSGRQHNKQFCSSSCGKLHYKKHGPPPISYYVPVPPKQISHGFETFFTDENEFHKWFNQSYFIYGIKNITKSDRLFPDVIAELHNGQRLNIELEYHASNFTRHNHTASFCDLIISYIKCKNHKSVCGVPVIAIFDVLNHELGTTHFEWNSRQLTKEFSDLVQNQCAVISQIVSDTLVGIS